ncbi:MAG: hypothetical protein ACYCXZ_03905 [Coriobacteriia bacterium]
MPCEQGGSLDYAICEQIADAEQYAADPDSPIWLHHARLGLLRAWLETDIQDHTDEGFTAVQASGIDLDVAMELAFLANWWLMGHSWRLESPTRAGMLESHSKSAWLNNVGGGAVASGLTMWTWLVGALLDVDWQPLPCTWSSEQVPRSAAMAHVAGRVVGRSVRPAFLNRLYGELGSAAFGLQLVSTQWSCGLGERSLCHGKGTPCPLIGGCHAYAVGEFPYADD